jgi:hypothetical protein
MSWSLVSAARYWILGAFLLALPGTSEARHSIADDLYFNPYQWDEVYYPGDEGYGNWYDDGRYQDPYDPWPDDGRYDDPWFPPGWDYPDWDEDPYDPPDWNDDPYNPDPGQEERLSLIISSRPITLETSWRNRGKKTLRIRLRQALQEAYQQAVESGEIRSQPRRFGGNRVGFLVALPLRSSGFQFFPGYQLDQEYLVLAVEGTHQQIYYSQFDQSARKPSVGYRRPGDSFRWDPGNRNGSWTFDTTLLGVGYQGSRNSFLVLCGFHWKNARIYGNLLDLGSLPALEPYRNQSQDGRLESLYGTQEGPRSLLSLQRSRGSWSSFYQSEYYSSLEIRDRDGAENPREEVLLKVRSGSWGSDRLDGAGLGDAVQVDRENVYWPTRRDDDLFGDFNLGRSVQSNRSRRDDWRSPGNQTIRKIRFTFLDRFIFRDTRKLQEQKSPGYGGFLKN